MIELIEDWLLKQVGIIVNLSNLSSNNIFQDGTILLKIFQKYGLLDDNFSVIIKKSSDKVECLKNYRHFKPLFDMLKVVYDENVISGCVEGNSTVVCKLLYELFVCVENNQHLYFITRQTYDEELKKFAASAQDKFKKIHVKESETSCCKTLSHQHFDLEKPFIQNSDAIHWYRNKCDLIKRNLESRLCKLKNQTSCHEDVIKKRQMQDKYCSFCRVTGRYLSKDEPLPDLDTLPLPSVDHETLLSYDNFIAFFKEKQNRNAEKKCLENNIQNFLLEETWNKIKENQKEKYKTILSEIMLKQSQYEKQIVTKLIQVENQVKLQNEHVSKINKNIVSAEVSQIDTDLSIKGFQEMEKMFADEQKRVQELHRKLYKEKQNIVKKRHYSLCYKIVSELVDIVALASEYKEKYSTNIPKRLWNYWMQMFFKGQPVHIPLDELQNRVEEDYEIEYDHVLALEKTQDHILNENDVEEYLLTTGNWYYKDICLGETITYRNILEQVIYRLLSIKYPLPPPPLPAEIPPFKLAGIIINFSDIKNIERLKILLSKQRIHMFTPDIAIKKCIETYEKENLPIVEMEKAKRIQSGKQSLNKRKKSMQRDMSGNVKNKAVSKVGRKKKNADELIMEKTDVKAINLIDKETQTGGSEEHLPKYSALGRVGEVVLRSLRDGEQINYDLMVSVIMEYLKNLSDFEGWVLVDFPLNLEQASAIEHVLTGKYLPIRPTDTTYENIEENIVMDEQSENIKSKILTLPNNNLGQSPFKTHFSFFINIKDETLNKVEEKSQKSKENNVKSKNSYILKETDEPIEDVLEQFYKDQSIYKEFYFSSFDLNTLKMLAKQILNISGINESESIELFGEESLKKLSKEIKVKKGKSSLANSKKPKKSPSVKKKGKTDTRFSQLPTEEIINDSRYVLTDIDSLLTIPMIQDLQPNEIHLKDEEWKIILFPVNNALGQILATMWENTEKQYLCNLNDIFFQNRVINSRLIPYYKYAHDEIERSRLKSDMRQNLINSFQNKYNSIESELRTVTEVKNKLHCQVIQLQQNLWEITDNRKNEIEVKRVKLIKENWIVNEICMLINNYFSLVQTEFDKSIETFKILQYYYLIMIDRNASSSINLPNGTFKVGRLTPEWFLNDLDYVSVISDDKSVGESYSSKTSRQRHNFIQDSLVKCEESPAIGNMLIKFVIKELELTLNRYQIIMNYFNDQIQREAKSLAPSKKGAVKEKSIITNKEKAKVGAKKIVKSSIAKISEEDIFKIELLLQECNCVFDNEKDNFLFRLDLIKRKACEDILEFYCFIESIFCELYNSNLKRYNSEILNINKVCEYLRTAIEEETTLEYDLVLTDDCFFIQSRDNIDNNFTAVRSLEEIIDKCKFTIRQLNNLKKVFNIAGPNGVIRKQSLCYIFKDLALSNDMDNQPYLPNIWNLLSESQLTDVMTEMFGPEYGVDWRDFIIYNLDIAFPTIDDILHLRKAFLCFDLEETEMVSKENYEKTSLWFEKYLPSNPEEGLRLVLIKRLLFDLFKVQGNYIKYTALLLYFCKDLNPKSGLSKALSLSIGKQVITCKDELDKILQEEKEIVDNVTNLLADIVNGIVQNREGVLIYEVDDDFEFIENEESLYSINVSSNSQFLDGEESSTPSYELLENKNANDIPIVENLHSSTENIIFDKWWVSKIPVTTIESVLNASFHYQDGTFSVMTLYLDVLEDIAETDGTIEGHVLMSSSCMRKLFAVTKKFEISLPCNIIQQILQRRPTRLSE